MSKKVFLSNEGNKAVNLMPSGVLTTDFTSIQTDWGKTLTRYTVTLSDDPISGEKQKSYSAGANFTGILTQVTDEQTREKFGLSETCEAYLMSSTVFNEWDKFSDTIHTYIVRGPIHTWKLPDGSVMYYKADLWIDTT